MKLSPQLEFNAPGFVPKVDCEIVMLDDIEIEHEDHDTSIHVSVTVEFYEWLRPEPGSRDEPACDEGYEYERVYANFKTGREEITDTKMCEHLVELASRKLNHG